MAQMIENLQVKFRNTSTNLFLFLLRLVSGIILGLTFSLIGQQAFAYGNVLFTFVIVLSTAVLLRISRDWSMAGVFLFDLFFVLIALILRMYIVVAPG